jgi:hypothetical protein
MWLPAAAFADSSLPAQQAPQQDFLTIIIWTIAALSIAELIRNAIQGLFARLSGYRESSSAQKAVGALAGMGALVGLANVIRATAGDHGGSNGEHLGADKGGSGIKLAGESVPSGDGSGSSARMAAAMKMPAGQTTGLEKAVSAGHRAGNALGSLARNTATTAAAMGMGIAGMAVPGGDRLAQAGISTFDQTVGAAAGYAGSAAGRFLGVQGNLLGQSWLAGKQTQQKTGGPVNVAEAFRMVAGGANVQDAVARSMKVGGAYAVHEQMGHYVIGKLRKDTEAKQPATGRMDSGVNY